MHDTPDNDLVRLYLAGETEALETLVKRYLSRIYIFTARFTNDKVAAEDITQETFVKVWKSIRKFDPDKHFKTWLFTIAKNTALDWLRKKKHIPMSALKDDETDEVFDIAEEGLPTAGELFDASLEKEAVLTAINNLPFPYKIVILLRLEEQFTFVEIAETLKEPLDTIKSRYSRGLKSLKKSLEAAPNKPLNT